MMVSIKIVLPVEKVFDCVGRAMKGGRGRKHLDNASRLKHLRDKKVVQRNRTRDLYDALDKLVPSRHEPAMADIGSLGSKRTILQLQDDTVDHLRNLKARRDAASGGGTCKQEPENEHTRRDAAKGGMDVKSGAEDAQLAEGMLASNRLFLLEVDIRGWIVLRASQGMHALFQYHPGQDKIVGESLLHYVAISGTKALRAAASETCTPGFCPAPFEIHLRTWEHRTHITSSLFRVQRFISQVPFREVLIFTRHTREPVTTDFGWTVEKMRDLCAVYQFDANRTTQAPWETEKQLSCIEPANANAGWNEVGLSQVPTASFFPTMSLSFRARFVSRARALAPPCI